MYDRCECAWKYTTNNAPAFVIIAKYVEIYVIYLLHTKYTHLSTHVRQLGNEAVQLILSLIKY